MIMSGQLNLTNLHIRDIYKYIILPKMYQFDFFNWPRKSVIMVQSKWWENFKRHKVMQFCTIGFVGMPGIEPVHLLSQSKMLTNKIETHR